MKMKKVLRIIFGMFILSILIIIWLIKTYIPLYDARLTLDIRNNTLSYIEDLKVTYSASDKVVHIPVVKPLGRKIILVSTKDVSAPVTEVYLTHNNKETQIIPKYRPEASDCAIISITNGNILVKRDSYMSNPLDLISFRWYGDIVDFDNEIK